MKTIRKFRINKQEEFSTIHADFSPSGWCHILIDEVRGCVSIHSDWGSYAFSWPNVEDLFSFVLLGERFDYIMGKMTTGEVRDAYMYFDVEESIKKLEDLVFDHSIYSRSSKEIPYSFSCRLEDIRSLDDYRTLEGAQTYLLSLEWISSFDIMEVMGCLTQRLSSRVTHLSEVVLPLIAEQVKLIQKLPEFDGKNYFKKEVKGENKGEIK